MSKQDKIFSKTEIIENDQSYISKLYKDLTNAISSNDLQSIWELSKTITRYQFKKVYD